MEESLKSVRFIHRILLSTCAVFVLLVLLSSGSKDYESAVVSLQKIENILATRRVMDSKLAEKYAKGDNLSYFLPLLNQVSKDEKALQIAIGEFSSPDPVYSKQLVGTFPTDEQCLDIKSLDKRIRTNTIDDESFNKILLCRSRSDAVLEMLPRNDGTSQEKSVQRAALELSGKYQALTQAILNKDENIWPIFTGDSDMLSLSIAVLPDAISPRKVVFSTIDRDISLSNLLLELQSPGMSVKYLPVPNFEKMVFFDDVVQGEIDNITDETVGVSFEGVYIGRGFYSSLKFRNEEISEVTLADTFDASSIAQVYDGKNFIGLSEVWTEIAAKSVSEAIKHVIEKLTESRSGINVLGVKVPYDGIQLVAPLFIIFNVLYLLGNVLHIAAIKSRSEGEVETFPWLMISPSNTSRLSMMCLTICLPTLIPVLIIFNTEIKGRDLLWSILACSVIFILIVTVSWKCHRIQRWARMRIMNEG